LRRRWLGLICCNRRCSRSTSRLSWCGWDRHRAPARRPTELFRRRIGVRWPDDPLWSCSHWRRRALGWLPIQIFQPTGANGTLRGLNDVIRNVCRGFENSVVVQRELAQPALASLGAASSTSPREMGTDLLVGAVSRSLKLIKPLSRSIPR
jgi:hypothetical protein